MIAARQKRKLVSKSPAMNLSRRKWSLQQASTYMAKLTGSIVFIICSNTVESTFFRELSTAGLVLRMWAFI